MRSKKKASLTEANSVISDNLYCNLDKNYSFSKSKLFPI